MKHTKTSFSGPPTSSSTLISAAAKAVIGNEPGTRPVRLTYKRQNHLGHGTFGVVFSVKVVSVHSLGPDLEEEVGAVADGTLMALKCLVVKRRCSRELSFLKTLRHANIVRLFYFYFSTSGKAGGSHDDDSDHDAGGERQLNLFLEYLPTTLYDELLQHGAMTEPAALHLAHQLFLALDYLHSRHICHRDLKPKNLLLNTADKVLKVCDLGSAKVMSSSDTKSPSYMCSRYYRPPELVLGAVTYDCQVDVWSAGCIVFEMVMATPLFAGQSSVDQLAEIVCLLGSPTAHQLSAMLVSMDADLTSLLHLVATRHQATLDEGLSRKLGIGVNSSNLSAVRTLLKRILVYIPDERPTAYQCLNYISGCDKFSCKFINSDMEVQ